MKRNIFGGASRRMIMDSRSKRDQRFGRVLSVGF